MERLFLLLMEKRELLSLLVNTSKCGQVEISYEKAELLKEYQQCRTAAKGCRILRCDNCDESVVLYNPCNRRGCPICYRKNQLIWQKKANARILPTKHLHLVYSFPDRITESWLSNSRETVKQLFEAVDRSIKKLEKREGLKLGRVLAFQSHGRGLSYKAHIHCLLSAGGLDETNSWKSLGVAPLAAMTTWIKEAMKAPTDEGGWGIHESRHESGESVVGYLTNKMNGVVANIDRLVQENQEIRVEERGMVIRLGSATFVQRYLNHIPPKGLVAVRYYGLYSNRQKVDYQQAKISLGKVAKEEKAVERHQECCPRCQSQLRLIGNYEGASHIDLRRYGFGVDPPEHRSMAKAS